MNTQVAIIIAWLVLLALIERLAPLRKATQPLTQRWPINIFLGVLIITTAAFTIAPTLHWSMSLHVGLLQYLPNAWQLPAGILLLDLSFYGWHRLNHTWSLLWRFHNIHHIDPDLDVSTAWRFHIVEILYSVPFRFVQVIVIGPSLWILICYELLFQCATIWDHSNVRLPKRIDNLLLALFVTPRMHGIHHSQVRAEHNANYGVIFSFWDRWFNTLVISVPQNKVTIGIAEYPPELNKLAFLVAHPFQKQRTSPAPSATRKLSA